MLRNDTTAVKPDIYDTANELDDITSRLKEIERLLRSVCDNYFERTAEATHPAVLHGQYDIFSTLVHMAANLLWDIVDEYYALSGVLNDYNKSIRMD